MGALLLDGRMIVWTTILGGIDEHSAVQIKFAGTEEMLAVRNP